MATSIFGQSANPILTILRRFFDFVAETSGEEIDKKISHLSMVFRNKAVRSELLDEDSVLAEMIIPTSVIHFEI